MIHQIWQVARTYGTRRVLWLLGAFGLFSLAPAAALIAEGGRLERIPPMLAAMGISFPVAITSYVIATHAKWQFCDSRARLTPNFAGPHLAVIGLVALVAFGLYPAVLTVSGHWSPFGVSACAVVVAAGSIWSIHSGRRMAVAIAFGVYLSLMTTWGLTFWINAENARRLLPVHAALLVGGWIAIAAWAVRLPRLREEDDDYFIPIQAHQGPATRMERTQAARALARMMGRSRRTQLIGDWWHDRLARIRTTTVRERRRLLRYGLAPTPMWINGISTSIAFFAMFYFMIKTGVIIRGGPTQSVLPALNVIILMPAMTPAGMLVLRRARMPQELVLPMARCDYIGGLFGQAARAALLMWTCSHAAILALLAATSPQVLTPWFVAGLTGLSLAIYLLVAGISLRTSPNSSGGKRIAMMMLTMFVAGIPLVGGMHMLGSPGVSREQAVAAALAEEAREQAALPTDIREALAADPQSRQRIQKSAVARWERSQPWPAAWLWTTVGVTAALGLGALASAQRRWMTFELA